MTQQNYYNPSQPPYPPQPPQPAKKKGLPLWLWIVLGVVAVLGLIIWLSVAAIDRAAESLSNLNVSASVDTDYSYEPYIARLDVKGTMAQETADVYAATDVYDHQYLLDTLAELQYDEMNMGLLLYIDSPGGEVMAASELGEAIAEYKAVTGRPVYAYGHDYAASGGYWVAAPADQFYVNRYCLTGSIGVTYGTMLDFSGLLEKYGVRTNTITSGAQKAMGSAFEEMTPETKAIFQALIDEYYGYFLDWVCQQRGMDRAVLQPLADGRIYTAAQAVNNGLADAVGDYDDCLAALKDVCGDYDVRHYEPSAASGWGWLLRYLKYEGNDMGVVMEVLPPTGVLAYYEG